MKLLFTACTRCGARNASPYGVCPECEDRQMHARIRARARVARLQVRRDRRAA